MCLIIIIKQIKCVPRNKKETPKCKSLEKGTTNNKE